jgi:hypothetical protein
MAQFATDDNIKEYEPDIHNYGIQDFSDLHQKSYDDIIRLLNIRWWKTVEHNRYDISIVQGTEDRLSPSKLVASEFTRAAVFHVLGHYIYSRLSTFDPNGDVFMEKMKYYKEQFEIEFDLILRQGISYDIDSSGTISDHERQTFHHNRLIR